jgi:hypothetical protein
MHKQQKLQRLNASGALLVFVEHAGSTMFYKSVLDLGNAAVSGDFGRIIFMAMLLQFYFVPFRLSFARCGEPFTGLEGFPS